eukprot:534580-Prymnesium_polylepis.1
MALRASMQPPASSHSSTVTASPDRHALQMSSGATSEGHTAARSSIWRMWMHGCTPPRPTLLRPFDFDFGGGTRSSAVLPSTVQ